MHCGSASLGNRTLSTRSGGSGSGSGGAGLDEQALPRTSISVEACRPTSTRTQRTSPGSHDAGARPTARARAHRAGLEWRVQKEVLEPKRIVRDIDCLPLLARS